MAKKSKREYVWLECSQCGNRNYRTSINVSTGTPKLERKKFCSNEHAHTVHKLRRK
jgi:large subunit ribosomal protein L33